ncbi:type VII secretion-associated protein [Corynebacterium sp. zg-331]|uniref:type VII secretion-associated protein n=1 Tax=unclassified Corynebacterium TaxID=2624378 RepID=UPI00128CC4CB|nr:MULTISPECIES: type VII secretion-associated protein [unclassified Corynebacterium]MBC3186004.1 type VII secretion-associated protein [Corynebacterium sp. zg-331]MPV52495.1 type VII secretion-associated protein [Corynebacterium sp. zg331]
MGLIVTILEEATVFEGTDTVYRYDLVPPVLAEPWAVTAVVEQAQALLEEDDQRVEVRMEPHNAEEDAECAAAVAVVVEALRAVGLGAPESGEAGEDTPTEVVESTPPVETIEPPPQVFPAGVGAREDTRGVYRRPVSRHGGGGYRAWWGRVTWMHGAIAGIIIAVLGLSWWAVGETVPEGLATQDDQPVHAAPLIGETSTPASMPSDALPAPPAAAEPPTVVHEVGGVRVTTPHGFRADLEGGDVVFRGEDTGLRIRVAAEPVSGVPVAAVLREVIETAERDPTLGEVEPKTAPQAEKEKVRYREEPGDGSVVQWSAWVEAGRHVSVGCHTREASTVVQRAACRMVEESLEIV